MQTLLKQEAAWQSGRIVRTYFMMTWRFLYAFSASPDNLHFLMSGSSRLSSYVQNLDSYQNILANPIPLATELYLSTYLRRWLVSQMNGILAHIFWKNSLYMKTGFIDFCLEGKVFITTLEMEPLPPSMRKNDI